MCVSSADTDGRAGPNTIILNFGSNQQRIFGERG